MPRQYKRKLGSRSYVDYTPEALQSCINAIANGMSQRIACATYGIPRSTLKTKIKGDFCNKPGGQTVFTRDEEESFVSHVVTLSEFGFPINLNELRYIVAAYLTKKGRIVKQFKINIPGYEWARSFLMSHPILTERFAANIKKARASVTQEVLSKYIDNLKEVVNGVPPTNLWNYDETNLTDDPGNKKVLCKKGCKYSERISNFSKISTSIMFCGNAAGDFLPPYVVYKAEHLWTTWCENGPKRCRYNCTKHGWFDAGTFQDWFDFHFLPVLKKKDGTKVIFGDNLSSHINPYVIQCCHDNDIKFVCLPPNTTHLTQPLEVAFYGPMKKAWHNILSKWKETKAGKKQTTLPKESFAPLLKTLMDVLEKNSKSNLISGFRKCGVYPVNKYELLSTLPSQDVALRDENISISFIQHLQENRQACEPKKSMSSKRKKINIPPGKSICPDDFIPNRSGIVSNSHVSHDHSKSVQHSKKRRSKKPPPNCDSSEEDEETYSLVSSGNSNMELSEEEIDVHKSQLLDDNIDPDLLECDQFITVFYDGQEFPGSIVSKCSEGVEVDCMVKGKKFWR